MKYLFTLCIAVMLSWVLVPVSLASSTEFSDAVSELTSSKLKQRVTAVEKLIATQDPRLEDLFQALLNSNLYYRKADKFVAIRVEKGTTINVFDALSGDQITDDGKWKKIIINNAIRRDLRAVIANLQLSSDSVDKRLNAIEQILSQLDEEQIQPLENRLQKEQEARVQQQLGLTIAALKLKTGQGDTLSLLKQLEDNAHPSVRQVVAELVTSTDDKTIRTAATQTLEKMDDRIARYGHVETLFFGLSLGSVLVLAAIGLAITFGVMGANSPQCSTSSRRSPPTSGPPSFDRPASMLRSQDSAPNSTTRSAPSSPVSRCRTTPPSSRA